MSPCVTLRGRSPSRIDRLQRSPFKCIHVQPTYEKQAIRRKERKRAGHPFTVLKPAVSNEPFKYAEIDESSTIRTAYHSDLFSAAIEGNAKTAEEVVRRMILDGFQPGAKAYHALVFAHVKSGSASGALAAIRRAHSSGSRPLTESYVILIYAFLKERNVKNAEAVFTSMHRPKAEVDLEKGWLMLTTMLFRQGFDEKAISCLQEGRHEDYTPDRILFSYIIVDCCARRNYEEALAELFELLKLQEDDRHTMYCEDVHVRKLLEHYGETGDVHMLMWLASLPSKLSIRSTNAVLLGILNAWNHKDIDAAKLFHHFWGQMPPKPDQPPDPMAMLLYTTAKLKQGDARLASIIFIDNNLDIVRGEKLESMMRALIRQILWKLSSDGYPIAMFNLMSVLSLSFKRLPANLIKSDSQGRSFLTQWLFQRHQAILEDDREFVRTTDGRQALLVDGFKIGFCDCLVTDEGVIRALSQLKVSELKAECKARGLSTEGKRKVLYDALKYARRGVPLIVDEQKRQRAVKREKKKRVTDVIKKTKRISKRKNLVDKEGNPLGKMVYYKEVEDPGSFVRELLAPIDDSDEDDEFEEEEVGDDMLEAGNIEVPKGLDIHILEERRSLDMGTDATAGANAAAMLCYIYASLNGYPTLEDFELIALINEKDRSPVVAWTVGDLLSDTEVKFLTKEKDEEMRQEEYRSRVLSVLNPCCHICFENGFPDAGKYILKKMKARGYPVAASLIMASELSKNGAFEAGSFGTGDLEENTKIYI